VISKDHFSQDVLDFFVLLEKYKVKYLIRGGEAVIYYGNARLTGDIDFFYGRQPNNIDNLYKALLEFWKNNIPGLKKKSELSEKDAVFQFGIPPNRIDLLNDIGNIKFEHAWPKKITERLHINDQSIHIHFMSMDQLIENKRAVARPKDLEDLKYLEAKNIAYKKK
jgi:hypothetical protein